MAVWILSAFKKYVREKSYIFITYQIRKEIFLKIIMDMEDLNAKIKIAQMKIQVETEPLKKQELNKSLRKLLLQRDIETIKKKIQQLG